MALETGTYIDDLAIANPVNTDGKNEGDNHLQAQFQKSLTNY